MLSACFLSFSRTKPIDCRFPTPLLLGLWPITPKHHTPHSRGPAPPFSSLPVWPLKPPASSFVLYPTANAGPLVGMLSYRSSHQGKDICFRISDNMCVYILMLMALMNNSIQHENTIASKNHTLDWGMILIKLYTTYFHVIWLHIVLSINSNYVHQQPRTKYLYSNQMPAHLIIIMGAHIFIDLLGSQSKLWA